MHKVCYKAGVRVKKDLGLCSLCVITVNITLCPGSRKQKQKQAVAPAGQSYRFVCMNLAQEGSWISVLP